MCVALWNKITVSKQLRREREGERERERGGEKERESNTVQTYRSEKRGKKVDTENLKGSLL